MPRRYRGRSSGEVLGSAEGLVLIFWSDLAHFHWATHDVTALFAKLLQGQYGRSILDQLHSEEHMKIMPLHFRFFICLDLFIDRHHCHGGSGTLESSASPELKSFLRDICTETSESTKKKSRSSAFVEECARITQASTRKSKVFKSTP